MYRIVNFFRGYAQLRVTGAAPEQCLNALSAARIPFWGISREDDLHFRLFVRRKDVAEAQRTAVKAFCSAELTGRFGFLQTFHGLRRRPVFLVGMLLAVAATFFLQGFVWTIQVEGNETVHDEEILRALETLDIRFGSWGADIDSQMTKHQMLNLVPELSWLAANRTGGCLHILVTERSTAKSETPEYAVASVVAARDGVLTQVSVLEGMKLCAVGDTVSKGQLLVSGYEDYGLSVRAVCANAEIYAQTWHTGTVLTPAQQQIKQYTGEEWTERTLIIGRKRINLSGNSGNYTTNCDKMVDVTELTLPGDISFPVSLETATYRSYETVAVDVTEQDASCLLTDAWKRMTEAGMIAGQIRRTEQSVVYAGGVYALHAQSDCEEMIARIVPTEEIYKGENNE